MKGSIAKYLAEQGWLIRPAATKYILNQKDPMEFIKGVVPLLEKCDKHLIDSATLQILRDKDVGKKAVAGASEATGHAVPSERGSINEHCTWPSKDERDHEPPFTINMGSQGEIVTLSRNFQPMAEYKPLFKDREQKIEVVKDITGQSLCNGKKDDFVTFFRARYRKMKEILKTKKLGVCIPVVDLKKGSSRVYDDGGHNTVIGLVSNILRTRTGEVWGFEIEDESGRLQCIISKDKRRNINTDFVLDEVVAAVGQMSKGRDRLYVEMLVRPSIPLHRPTTKATEDVCALFISDIHLGSKTFLTEQWMSLLKWLGGGYSEHIDLLNRLKYIVIAGDVVDGIGVYPNQKHDLDITDIDLQYETLAKHLEMIPGHIEIIIIPGNHDAVRAAEPQPALKEDYQKLFTPNVHFLGNPATFKLNGVTILAYHGAGFDDWISTKAELNYTNPLEAMKEMMFRRHILPMYGMKTPLAPEKNDHLIMDPAPEIFVTGHTHSFGVAVNRNSLLINCSTWQSQTDYQKMHNFLPILAKATIVNLKDMNHTVLDFADGRPTEYLS